MLDISTYPFGFLLFIHGYLHSKIFDQTYDMQCFPLYSLILATGNRTINYLRYLTEVLPN